MGEEHVVHDQADAAFGAIVAGIAAQPTNVEARDAGVLLQGAEIGHAQGKFAHPLDPLGGQLRAGNGRDGQRHVLEPFLAMAGGDGDGIGIGHIRTGRIGHRRRRLFGWGSGTFGGGVGQARQGQRGGGKQQGAQARGRAGGMENRHEKTVPHGRKAQGGVPLTGHRRAALRNLDMVMVRPRRGRSRGVHAGLAQALCRYRVHCIVSPLNQRGTRSLAMSPQRSRALAVGNAEQAASRSKAAGPWRPLKAGAASGQAAAS